MQNEAIGRAAWALPAAAAGLLAASVLAQPWRSLVVAGLLVTAALAIWALARRQSALVASLLERVDVDHLTRLLNRRGYQARIEVELARARREETALALVVADVDDFKQVNDRLGHLGGDMALERVAAAIARTSRATDVTARLGGDEFAIVLPGAAGLDALAFAERLRRRARQSFSGTSADATLSLGIAVYPADGRSAEELLHAADQAMYRAKALGKDRTAMHGTDAPLALETA